MSTSTLTTRLNIREEPEFPGKCPEDIPKQAFDKLRRYDANYCLHRYLMERLLVVWDAIDMSIVNKLKAGFGSMVMAKQTCTAF